MDLEAGQCNCMTCTSRVLEDSPRSVLWYLMQFHQCVSLRMFRPKYLLGNSPSHLEYAATWGEWSCASDCEVGVKREALYQS